MKDKIDTWPQLNDNMISNEYSVEFLPTQFLIDKTGTIIHRYDDINEPFANLEKDLKEIFKK